MNKREAQHISDKVVTMLKEERIRKGLTPYRVALDTGLSKNSILYIERLTQKPSFLRLLFWLTILKRIFLKLSKKPEKINSSEEIRFLYGVDNIAILRIRIAEIAVFLCVSPFFSLGFSSELIFTRILLACGTGMPA